MIVPSNRLEFIGEVQVDNRKTGDLHKLPPSGSPRSRRLGSAGHRKVFLIKRIFGSVGMIQRSETRTFVMMPCCCRIDQLLYRETGSTIDLQVIPRDRSRVPARIASGGGIFEFKHHVVIRIQTNQQCFGEGVGHRVVDQDRFIRSLICA